MTRRWPRQPTTRPVDEPEIGTHGHCSQLHLVRAMLMLMHAMRDQTFDDPAIDVLWSAYGNLKRELFERYPAPRAIPLGFLPGGPGPARNVCVVCLSEPVCPEDGQDTCDYCARRI